MSHKATDWAWATPAATGVRKYVLLALAERANVKTGKCNPSLPELASKTGIAESSVRTHIRALESAGLIDVDVTHGGRRKRSTYTLRLDRHPSYFEETHREPVGRKPEETHREPLKSQVETHREPSTNPPSDGAVELRSKTRTREPVSTGAACASPGQDDGLFPKADLPRPPAHVGEQVPAALTAGDAMASWAEGFTECHDAKPTAQQRGQAARECRLLIEAGNPVTRVMAAARSAGSKGYATVQREYQVMSRLPAAATQGTTDRRLSEHGDLVAFFENRGTG